jgi:hypothetical protein
MDWLTESRRAYFYRVALALMAVGTIYGIVDDTTGPAFLAVIFAVLGLGTSGLAAANTSTSNTEEGA